MPTSRSQTTSPTVSHQLRQDEQDEQHQQDSLPEANDDTHDESSQQTHPLEPGDPRRSRACEACRGLKVKCEPATDDGPCARCKKAGRECIVTAPSRKRQRKTDSRVSELERKIDALTQSLQAKNAAAAAAASTTPSDHNSRESPSTAARHPSIPGTVRHEDVDRQAIPSRPPPPPPPSATSMSTPSNHAPPFQPPLVMAGQKRKAPLERSPGDGHASGLPRSPASITWGRSLEPDAVDRGIITMDLAADLFTRFRDRMIPHLPIIAFPASLTVAELRRTRPVLFLAIMTAAASDRGTLQRTLHRELLPILADRVFLSCDKTIDLVQSLLISTIWYCPPDNFEELKFYQLVHSAAIMAIDIGLGRKPAPGVKRTAACGDISGGVSRNWQNPPFRRHPLPDATSMEARRTWLAVFFMTSNASIALRRPNLVRWTSFMAESVDMLENSPDAAPTDKYFCHLVWTHRLTEDLSAQFNLEDPSVLTDINEPRSQHVLRALERDLDRYRASVPQDLVQPTLSMAFDMASLWMHEAVLHNSTTVDQLRPPFNTDTFEEGIISLEPLSAAQINAISACIASADALFTTFLALDIPTVRCLPTFSYVRVAYSLVIILKLYFSASSPRSELGRVVDKDSLRVDYYLGALQDKFRLIAANDGSRAAVKFMIVLTMLSLWLAKHAKPDGGSSAVAATSQDPPPPPPLSSSSRTPSSSQQQQQQQHHHLAHTNENTPLQLLSEVATGSDADHHHHNHSHNHGNNTRGSFPSNPRQPFFYDTPSSTPDMQRSAGFQPPPPPHSTDAVPLPPPALAMDMSWMGEAFLSHPPGAATLAEGGGPGTLPFGSGDDTAAAAAAAMGFGTDMQMAFHQGAGADGIAAGMMGFNDAFFSDMFMGERNHFFPF